MSESKLHPLYTGDRVDAGGPDSLNIPNDPVTKFPIRFKLQKPQVDGKVWDQTFDAAKNMRYAHSLGLPELQRAPLPRMGKAIIVGGAPSIIEQLPKIRAFSEDPDNMVFAVNWTHTWMLQRGITPDACVFFEIDAEPEDTLKAASPDVTYYICSHCHPKTFDELKGFKRVLWHSPPNSEPEAVVAKELFPNSNQIGGGVGTFTRTMTVALNLGFRQLELFGIDSSFSESGATHVEGYSTPVRADIDGLDVWAYHDRRAVTRQFRTSGTLALQVEEFKEYCKQNHAHFACRVHGDSLMKFTHASLYPSQYPENDEIFTKR